jgi:integral membrane protein
MKIKTLLGHLRFLAIAEGISFLLFALTMPLKYVWGITGPNMLVGMIHGFLFIAYIAWVIANSVDRSWTLKTTFWASLASLIPGGTFIVDKHLFKKMLAK